MTFIRFTRRNLAVSALFVLAVSVLSTPVDAKEWDFVDGIDIRQPYDPDPVVSVQSNAEGFHTVQTAAAPYPLYISGSCTAAAKADGSSIWVFRSNGSSHRAWIKDWGWKDRDVSTSLDISVPLHAGEKQRIVNACNAKLEQLTGSGMSMEEALSSDHIVDTAVHTLRHGFSCTGNLHLTGSGETMDIPGSLKVLCRKAPAGSFPEPHEPPTGPGSITQQFGVTEAEVDVTPEISTVITKADLTVSGQIVANGPGQVRYRLRHNGQASDVGTVNFPRAGTHDFSYPLTVRCDSQQSSSGGSGGIGGIVATPPGSTRTGLVRVEILSPTTGVRVSERAGYTVNCRETGQVATPLPDLVVTEVRPEGRSGRVAVHVRNSGARGAGQSTLKLIVMGRKGLLQKTASVKNLGSGQQASLIVDFQHQLPGGASVQAIADQPGAIQESNEGNNTKGSVIP